MKMSTNNTKTILFLASTYSDACEFHSYTIMLNGDLRLICIEDIFLSFYVEKYQYAMCIIKTIGS